MFVNCIIKTGNKNKPLKYLKKSIIFEKNKKAINDNAKFLIVLTILLNRKVFKIFPLHKLDFVRKNTNDGGNDDETGVKVFDNDEENVEDNNGNANDEGGSGVGNNNIDIGDVCNDGGDDVDNGWEGSNGGNNDVDDDECDDSDDDIDDNGIVDGGNKIDANNFDVVKDKGVGFDW